MLFPARKKLKEAIVRRYSFHPHVKWKRRSTVTCVKLEDDNVRARHPEIVK